MTSKDTSFHTQAVQLRGKYLRYFHALNPTKQLEGPHITTSSSTLVDMKSYIGPVITQTAPVNISTEPSDTINANGISLSPISGLPANLYPAVNVNSDSATVIRAQFIIQQTPLYTVPSGFTFLNNWYWDRYNSNFASVSTTTTSNDTITGVPYLDNGTYIYNNAAVFGNIPILPSTKIMFSIMHSIWSTYTDNEGIGIGTSDASIINYLGSDLNAIGIYDDGYIYSNNTGLNQAPYSIFETNGQIIDVAVDTIVNKMWYRVNGGPWQG